MSTEELYNANQEYRYEIVDLREKIWKLEKIIKENEKKMWNSCEHEWVYDTSCGVYERNRYYCKTCKLWKNGYLYG